MINVVEIQETNSTAIMVMQNRGLTRSNYTVVCWIHTLVLSLPQSSNIGAI